MFTISFRRPNSGFAVSLPSTEIGLDGIDFIRQETGVSLELDRMKPVTQHRQEDPTFHLTEEQARRCRGLFLQRNRLIVEVPDQRLNGFMRQKVWVDKDQSTGEIKKASIEYTCDTGEIIEAWILDGCPPEWEFPELD